MKKSIYKYISIILCAIMLSTQILFGCLTVRTHAEENAVQWLQDHFNDAVSAIGGAVFNATIDCWNAWKTLLGLNDEELNDFIINGVSVGGDGNVTISDDVADSIKDFVNDYQTNNTDFTYGYSSIVSSNLGGLYQRNYYTEIVRIVEQNPNSLCIPINFSSLRSNSSSKYEDTNWAYCFKLYVIDNCVSYVYSGINTNSYTSPNSRYFIGQFYDENWENVFNNSENIRIYTFKNASSESLTLSEHSPSTNNIALFTDSIYSGSVNINNFSILIPLTKNIIQYPVFRTIEIMQYYSVGNLPYYLVPTNPNVNYANGSYNVTTTQLDNSISYGDISSYVNSNNVTDYNVVNTYITNYYINGSGSGGSGGSGSGGSGSDIDWSWLGRIGEVIGGLISALGNVIAGVIDAIASLIESLTVNLPNTLGQLIAWLMPFLPEEITALLGAFFMVVVIIGVIKLLRR